MKRIILPVLLMVIAGLLVSETGNAQPPWAPAWGKRRKMEAASYYYYPEANTYYNPANRQYIYPKNGVWVSVGTPHFNFSFSNMPRYTVYSEGPVWMENRYHVMHYHGICHEDEYYDRCDEERYEHHHHKWHHHHDEDEDDDD